MTRGILVTGAHRSGTTWVGRTLATATGVVYVHEPFNVSSPPTVGVFPLRMPRWYMRLSGDGGPYRRAFRRTLELRFGWIAALMASRRPADVRQTFSEWRRWSHARRRGARVLIKDPIALLSAEWLASNFPLDVIVLIRHPAAVAASLKRLDWWFAFGELESQPAVMEILPASFAEEIRDFARNDRDIVDQAALVWKILYYVIDGYRHRHPDWTFVRHEDLAQDPERGFRELFDRVSLEFTDDVRQRIEQGSADENPRDAAPGRILHLERASRALVSSWKDLLNPEEIDRVRGIVEPLSRGFYGDDEW
ncbi:MAG: hypothetical protein QOD06_2399 [Candidatus Binatota bacterium]|jgi:hypothetical protein|nr:hypothetical protein [Candidatus Binatota bacterium]